jgi:hypothetical protein
MSASTPDRADQARGPFPRPGAADGGFQSHIAGGADLPRPARLPPRAARSRPVVPGAVQPVDAAVSLLPAGWRGSARISRDARGGRHRSLDRVALPTHEQAWLLSCARDRWPATLRFAVAGGDAFARVQSKIAFARPLDELELPQPGWRVVRSESDLGDRSFPCWLKRAFSTAGDHRGEWRQPRGTAGPADFGPGRRTRSAGGAPRGSYPRHARPPPQSGGPRR